jgi:hypothetical protein
LCYLTYSDALRGSSDYAASLVGLEVVAICIALLAAGWWLLLLPAWFLLVAGYSDTT